MGFSSIKLFITESEADAILSDATWAALTTEEKETHILNATLYIQSTYRVGIYSDADSYETADVPALLKDAAAYLANEDRKSAIFVADTGIGNLAEKSVGVGSLKKTERYETDKYKWVDKYPVVTSMLTRSYPLLKSGVVMVPLIRR